MAIYRCNLCDNFIDNDYHPCAEDPRQGQGHELVCEDCLVDLEEEVNGEDYRKPRVSFTRGQQIKMEEHPDDY